MKIGFYNLFNKVKFIFFNWNNDHLFKEPVNLEGYEEYVLIENLNKFNMVDKKSDKVAFRIPTEILEKAGNFKKRLVGGNL